MLRVDGETSNSAQSSRIEFIEERDTPFDPQIDLCSTKTSYRESNLVIDTDENTNDSKKRGRDKKNYKAQ